MTETTTTEEDKPEGQKLTSPTELLPGATHGLTIDWGLFGQYLEDSDISEAEKREFIEVLWNIVVAFVDLGLGIHPAQLANPDCCGQNDEIAKSATRKSSAMGASSKLSSAHFEACANGNETQRSENRRPE